MSRNNPVFVLDSFALLAYLNDEPGRARVKEVLRLAEQGLCRVLLCMINFGEVLYTTERRRGLATAQSVQSLIESMPISILDTTRNLVLDAAHIKANHALSYADAFAVAAALRESAIILTGDPEFASVESIVTVEWLEKSI
ncbi:MAG: type II toxin-antitoxin system VapC family toxin [Anaerolineales bacterium]|nr:type II toxin-antitoxin system VapC family toxin [Anaerolineales bacterium]